MKPFVLNATTISDAWYLLIKNLPDYAYFQRIQKGSFEGEQVRHQYPGVAIYIEHPDQDMVPHIPEGLGIPSPTSMEVIEEYFVNYLMDPTLSPNETYRYSSRIHEVVIKPNEPVEVSETQFAQVIQTLRNSPLTNQAIIEIGSPQDLATCWGKDGKFDPPCLRLIDFKVLPGMILSLSCYFRSWDLWAGLPTNLGGLELLKQYVAQEAGLINGPMYAYSSGLHLYGFQEELARIRAGVVLTSDKA